MRIQNFQPVKRQTDETAASEDTGKEKELRETIRKGRRNPVRVVRARQERTGILYTERRLIKSPEDILAVFGGLFERAGVEQVIAVALTKREEPVAVQLIAVGGVDSCMVSVAEILKLALLSNCPHIFLLHNHPSGSPEPSREDRAITERVKKAAEIVGIDLMDHVIVGSRKDGYSILGEREIHLSETDPETNKEHRREQKGA